MGRRRVPEEIMINRGFTDCRFISLESNWTLWEEVNKTLREDVKKGTGTMVAQVGNTTFQIIVDGKNKITLVKGNNPVDTFTSVDDLIIRDGYIFQK